MESILEELDLKELYPKFMEEKIEIATVMTVEESYLIELGVKTKGDRIRLRQKCEVASQQPPSQSTSTSSLLARERALLFSPYRNSRTNSQRHTTSRRRGSSRKSVSGGGRSWTVNFFCLSSPYQTEVPSVIEKEKLQNAGLGLKKIKLNINDDEFQFYDKLTSNEKLDDDDDGGEIVGFPRLKDGGGFDLMQCYPNSRKLRVIDCSVAQIVAEQVTHRIKKRMNKKADRIMK